MGYSKTILATVLALVATTTTLAWTQQAVDTAELNEVEELSEALANDLLDLSLAVRDKDSVRLALYFADDLFATPIPAAPEHAGKIVDWISDLDWPIEPAQHTDRPTFLAGFERLLERFASIEDARFKVKEANFDGDSGHGTARLKFFIVGRDDQGRREWINAWADVEADKVGEHPWQINYFVLDAFASLVAEREIFSEIAIPAGVHELFPKFGTAPNDTVVAHGVAVSDVDGDGLIDVVTTGVIENHLYLNDGEGGFVDVSDETFVSLTPPAGGPLFFDYDNDGDQDLFFAVVGNQVLLENRLVPDGTLHFLDRSLEAGVSVAANGFSAVAADINHDGLPDVYVASYNRYGLVMPNSWDQATNGTPNLLFINQGDGTFRESAEAWGVSDSRWSYAAAFADIDSDGDQDLYVTNDFGENGLYLNEGDHFREAAAANGVLDPGNGMGVTFGDYDNDGDLDLHVTNMSSTAGNRILARLYPDADPADLVLKKLAVGNSLYANNGDGSFTSVTADVGGISASWAFGGGFIDFDNDGWEDIYSPNGFISGETMADT